MQVRLGVLAAEHGTVLPATSLFEVEAMRLILAGTVPYQRAGLMWLYSPTADLEAYAEKKLREYQSRLDLFGRYDASPVKDAVRVARRISWLPRLERSAFADISASWRDALEPGGDLDRLSRLSVIEGRRLNDQEVARLEAVPAGLEGQAFILSNVIGMLPKGMHPRAISNIATLNNRAYVLSYIAEHSATIFVDTPLGGLSFGVRGRHPDGSLRALSMTRYLQALEAAGLAGVLMAAAPAAELIRLKGDPVFRSLNRLFLADCERPASLLETTVRRTSLELNEKRKWFDYPSLEHFLHDTVHRLYDRLSHELDLRGDDELSTVYVSRPAPPEVARPQRKPRRKTQDARQSALEGMNLIDKASAVFLVHGRDDVASRWMRDFLRSIGLEPLEWSQAVALTQSGTPFVLDIIRKGMAATQATVVLFTPDEEVRLRSAILSDGESDQSGAQSRPNVWFEAGLAMGLHPDRTVLATIGDNRPGSDLAGIHFIHLRKDPSSLHELANRLRTVGCSVNLTGTDYLQRPVEYRV